MFDVVAEGCGLNVAVTAAALAVCMLILWLLSIRVRDVSIVDVLWGPGFALVAAVGAALGGGAPARKTLVVALVTLWGSPVHDWRNFTTSPGRTLTFSG